MKTSLASGQAFSIRRAKTEQHPLVDRVGGGRHHDGASDQLIAVAVVGKGLEILEREGVGRRHLD